MVKVISQSADGSAKDQELSGEEILTESRSIDREKKKKSLGKSLLLLVVIAVIVIGGGFFVNKYVVSGMVGGSDWQAVFLANNQVYFGKIVSEDKSTIVLRDIYYLQVIGELQSGTEATANNGLSLIKLGNELHGPKDQMRIVRSNVLFIESLKNDSKVVEAIDEYLADLEGTSDVASDDTASGE